MFVALQIKNQTRVTSIASEWDNAEDELRAMAAAGELVCPGCKQSLWLRTGRRRRRHFAHRNLADCPLAHQSPEVLEVKAHLFRWLEKKYPGQVNLDFTLGVRGYDKTLDLVVQSGTDSTFAYWIFDRQQRERYDLLRYQALDGVSLQFIHTASTLETAASNTILLSASQRDFITYSDFDTECGGHLHFIAEDSTVSLYRGLGCVHRPNVYHSAIRRQGRLETALISPKTGEIVFNADVQARQKWRQQQLPKPPPSPLPKPTIPSAPLPQPTIPPVPVETEKTPTEISKPEEPSLNINGPFRCEMCGTVTMDWSQATPSKGTCICRPCIRARRNKPA